MSEQLLTIDEAAAALKLHVQTVREHLRTGQLRGVKRGRQWRVPESALLDGQTTATAPPTGANSGDGDK